LTSNSVATTRDDHLVAWLAALAIAIHMIESALPSPLPGVKPGLANVITVAALILFGWRIAAWVSVLRVLAGSMLMGTFLSPTFVLSIAGAIASLAALALVYKLPDISALGLCVIAAIAHMTTQIYMAYLLFIPHEGLFKLLPILMTVAVVAGTATGLICQRVVNATKETYSV
jgi:heptaprenyl diphosphate synthase